ncbi:MAG: hypothetical protein XD63_0611 [Thermoanaerobacterales bacterium 50_218]|nr:MAG: hypothetical protein XD63_0611 [Thermoanaerobacterales bacterium 50_218]
MHKITTFTLGILQPILEEPQEFGDIVLKVAIDAPKVALYARKANYTGTAF